MRIPLLSTVLVLAACGGGLPSAGASDAAATPAPAAPGAAAPPPLDPVTAHRAEEAADRYQAEQQALSQPVDPQSQEDLAEAEVLLLEAKTYLDQHDTTKAGTAFVAAGDKLHGIKPAQRPPLGARYRDAETRLTALSQALLASDAVDTAEHTATGAAVAEPAAPALPPPALPAAK